MSEVRSAAMTILAALVAVFAVSGSSLAENAPSEVSVQDSGPQHSQATDEKHQGHKWERRTMTLDNGTARYTFQYSACVDPSHGDQRFGYEGYFGMPGPSSCNWYHGGFLFVSLNGKDIGSFPLSNMQVVETGARGTFQMVFEHPDAVVRLRTMLLPGANHVLADLTWKARLQAEVKTITLRTVCYPSFFTAWHHRQGDRHCSTPRADKHEPEVLELDPEKDTYLYYYDTVFDVAKGEGEGPCAMMFTPECIKSGRVQIGNYGVTTELEAKPEARRLRLAFWDFNGKKNAEADTYFKAHGVEDQRQLAQVDFRPEPIVRLNVAQLQAEAEKYLKQAGEEAKAYRPQVEELLGKVRDLKGKADEGDWKAETELATVLAESTTLFWKLKIAALLNE